MSLLETITGAMGGSGGGTPAAGGSHQGLLQEAMHLIGNNSQAGGLSGLLDKFRGAGLGHLADGWVGTGPNPPATAEHVQQALGQDQIGQIAGRLGIPPQQAASGLATILPYLIDHLTPSGSIPNQSAMSGVLQARASSWAALELARTESMDDNRRSWAPLKSDSADRAFTISPA